MKTHKKIALGRRGEAIAAQSLEADGYILLARNWRTPYGEIDLVARHGEVIVFVEVKTRSSESLGPPEIAITRRKAQHMHDAAEYYIQQHPELTNDWRIDLITIQLKAGNDAPVIDKFENILA